MPSAAKSRGSKAGSTKPPTARRTKRKPATQAELDAAAEEKKQKRLIRNRLSAAQHRERQREFVQGLENRISQGDADRAVMLERIRDLEARLLAAGQPVPRCTKAMSVAIGRASEMGGSAGARRGSAAAASGEVPAATAQATAKASAAGKPTSTRASKRSTAAASPSPSSRETSPSSTASAGSNAAAAPADSVFTSVAAALVASAAKQQSTTVAAAASVPAGGDVDGTAVPTEQATKPVFEHQPPVSASVYNMYSRSGTVPAGAAAAPGFGSDGSTYSPESTEPAVSTASYMGSPASEHSQDSLEAEDVSAVCATVSPADAADMDDFFANGALFDSLASMLDSNHLPEQAVAGLSVGPELGAGEAVGVDVGVGAGAGAARAPGAVVAGVVRRFDETETSDGEGEPTSEATEWGVVMPEPRAKLSRTDYAGTVGAAQMLAHSNAAPTAAAGAVAGSSGRSLLFSLLFAVVMFSFGALSMHGMAPGGAFHAGGGVAGMGARGSSPLSGFSPASMMQGAGNILAQARAGWPALAAPQLTGAASSKASSPSPVHRMHTSSRVLNSMQEDEEHGDGAALVPVRSDMQLRRSTASTRARPVSAAPTTRSHASSDSANDTTNLGLVLASAFKGGDHSGVVHLKAPHSKAVGEVLSRNSAALAGPLQLYANAAMDEWVDSHKDDKRASGAAASGAARPSKRVNASYVMCPDAVAQLASHSVAAVNDTAAHHGGSRAPGSALVPRDTMHLKPGYTAPGAHSDGPAADGLDYMLLLVPSSSLLGSDGTPYANAGWMEIGCNVLHARHVHSVRLAP